MSLVLAELSYCHICSLVSVDYPIGTRIQIVREHLDEYSGREYDTTLSTKKILADFAYVDVQFDDGSTGKVPFGYFEPV